MHPGRIPPVQNSPDKVQLQRLSHVCYSHTDLSSFATFAKDFGLDETRRDEDNGASTLYFRGWGPDACCYVASQSANGRSEFLKAAFLAATEADLLKAAELESSSVVGQHNGPGGGRKVTITSPSGTVIDVIWGCMDRQIQDNGIGGPRQNAGENYNTPLQKSRKGNFQRFTESAALVYKIGHYGFTTALFDEDVAFYTSNFNFVPSDILYEVQQGREVDVLTFMHLDHGQSYSDHHTLFFFRQPSDAIIKQAKIHHSSFEVENFDSQLLGHSYLLRQGYKPVWGVGRHVLGSQIFDYWKDPSGFTVEHYADGDIVNCDTPTGRELSNGDASMYVWGPERPKGGVGGS